MAAPVSADVIGLRTAIPVGEKFSIALNENVKATLAWGDGTTEEVSFNGAEVGITVKHAELTLTSEKNITNLYCPDCALTELNLSNVPNLNVLICPDNQLKNLDLSATTKLTELNCEGNQMTSLKLSKCPELVTVNCSNNQLTSLSATNQEAMKTLLCANNKLTSLSIMTAKNLEALWCQGNGMKTLTLASTAKPSQICAFDNEFTTFPTVNLEDVKEFWVDNNKLQTLDLSKVNLETLSASNNLLTDITFHEDLTDNLKYFYVDNNSLLFNSFPTLYHKSSKDTIVVHNISDQRPYEVASLNVNESVDLKNKIRDNAIGDHTRVVVTWMNEAGAELVRNKDYKVSNYKYTFLTPNKGVHATLTSQYYPELVLKVAKFDVIDPTGINDVEAADGIRVSVNAGQLKVVCSKDTHLRIYNVSGVLLINENVVAGTHAWTLPAGLYVVNGKKVVVNH